MAKHRIENVMDRGEWRGTVYDLISDHLKSIHPNVLGFSKPNNADHKLRVDFVNHPGIRFFACSGQLYVTFGGEVANLMRRIDVGDTFGMGE